MLTEKASLATAKKLKQANDGEQTVPPLQKVEKDFVDHIPVTSMFCRAHC